MEEYARADLGAEHRDGDEHLVVCVVGLEQEDAVVDFGLGKQFQRRRHPGLESHATNHRIRTKGLKVTTTAWVRQVVEVDWLVSET